MESHVLAGERADIGGAFPRGLLIDGIPSHSRVSDPSDRSLFIFALFAVETVSTVSLAASNVDRIGTDQSVGFIRGGANQSQGASPG